MAIIPWDDERDLVTPFTKGARGAPLNDQRRRVDPLLPSRLDFARAEEGLLEEQNRPSVLGAAWRQTVLGSVLAMHDDADGRQDPDFDLFEKIKGTRYEGQEERFFDIFNDRAFEARMRQLDMEREDRSVLHAAGFWGGLLSFGMSNLLDPTIVLPGGAIYRGVRGGYAIGKSALSVGVASGAKAAASETVLQSTQQLRTKEESAFAIGGSIILGSLLGGGVAAYLGRSQRRELAKKLDELARSKEPDEIAANEIIVEQRLRPSSAGDAVVKSETLEELSVAGAAAGGLTRMTNAARLNPLVRLVSSPSPLVRSVATTLLENPVYLKKNIEGKASEAAVETLVKETQGRVAEAVTAMRREYRAYRKAGGQLSRSEFRQAVGMSMRRAGKHSDPHIAAAAQAWRSNVFEPLTQQAIELGRLRPDVDVTMAESHFSRLWNWRKIEANEPQFKAIVSDWVRTTVDAEVARLARVRDVRKARIHQEIEDVRLPAAERPRMRNLADRAETKDPKILEGRINTLQARLADIDQRYADRVGLDADNNYESYIDEVVTSIYDQLTGRADSVAPRDLVPTMRGPLKERTFNIPDRLIEDFLESDIELVGRRYARIMAAEIELTRKFGSPNMSDQLKAIEQDYTLQRKRVADDPQLTAKDRSKRLARLNRLEKRDKRDIEAIRDMLRGTYLARENQTNLARVLAMANIYNYVRMMGGVVASSFSDVARPMMVHGLGRYMNKGIVPLVSNLKAIKLTAKESRYAGIAEAINNSRVATMAEITDPYSMSSPFAKLMENLATGLSKANGLVYWNGFQKLFVSSITQARVLDGVTDFGAISRNERAYLAFLGIDQSMAERIARQFDEHGQLARNIKIANSTEWTDHEAVRTFRAAINKDVDSMIVTKGIGDVPLMARTPIGRTVLQFRSFALASHQRALMRGLQGAELGVDGGRAGMLAGMITATTIGMMIYWLKSVEANRQDDISDNPGLWIAEGLDRSGLFSVFFEVNNLFENASGIGAYSALQAAFPDTEQTGKASPYANQSTVGAMMGPTGEFADTLVEVTSGLTRGDLRESDIDAIRRLAPGGTLPVVRSLLEYQVIPHAKEAVAD